MALSFALGLHGGLLRWANGICGATASLSPKPADVTHRDGEVDRLGKEDLQDRPTAFVQGDFTLPLGTTTLYFERLGFLSILDHAATD
jgi:hypothetical protein